MTNENKMTTYDFKDGKGLVPAHQHSNGGGWVADTATVDDTAHIGPDAKVYGNARVYDKARVYGNGKAQVSGNAILSGNAIVSGNALVSANAQIYDKALVSGYAHVFGDAKVYGNARLYDTAKVYGNAQVCGDALLYANAQVFGDAKVSSNQHVSFSIVKTDLSLPENMKESIEAQCNLTIFNDYVYCYKRVNDNLSSEYDNSFIYPVSGLVEAEEVEDNKNVSCGKGLHFSHLSYYARNAKSDSKILYAKVHVDDIINCLQGKIRVRKAEILGVV